MGKKYEYVTWLTLIVFTVFTFSCYHYKKKEIKTEASWYGKKVQIIEVSTTTDRQVKFSRRSPGKIEEKRIVGIVKEAGKKKQVSIPLSEVQWVRVKKINAVGTVLVATGFLVIVAAIIGLSSMRRITLEGWRF